jgi:hypothetical protein
MILPHTLTYVKYLMYVSSNVGKRACERTGPWLLGTRAVELAMSNGAQTRETAPAEAKAQLSSPHEMARQLESMHESI